MWKQEIVSHQTTTFLINSLPTCHEAATLVISTMGLRVGQALFRTEWQMQDTCSLLRGYLIQLLPPPLAGKPITILNLLLPTPFLRPLLRRLVLPELLRHPGDGRL